MRDVAVVSFAQSPCLASNRRDDMAEILLPVIREALGAAGIGRDEVDFFASGSHDFYEGRTFAYIESLD
ncbi:MAG TPA: lipid-transfer protein, partial [Micromonosporaceae bacterium]|nr:lipid-transfer protein [Micromonosporaceae bacterium]